MKNHLLTKSLVILCMSASSLLAFGNKNYQSQNQFNSKIEFTLNESYNSLYSIRRGIATSRAKDQISQALSQQGCRNISLTVEENSMYRYFIRNAILTSGLSLIEEIFIPFPQFATIGRTGKITGYAVCPTEMKLTGHVKHYSSLPIASRNKFKIEITELKNNQPIYILDESL